MTREEERKQRAEEIFDLPQSQAIFMCGAQWADKTMIEKAAEWLEYNLCYYDENHRGIDSGNSLIDDFKQAMMEE